MLLWWARGWMSGGGGGRDERKRRKAVVPLSYEGGELHRANSRTLSPDRAWRPALGVGSDIIPRAHPRQV